MSDPDAGQASARQEHEPTQEAPAAGEDALGLRDPVERDPTSSLEQESAFYGAGEAVAEAPETPPFSSSLYPASSQATGMTHEGDQVVGIEDAPQDGLGDETP